MNCVSMSQNTLPCSGVMDMIGQYTPASPSGSVTFTSYVNTSGTSGSQLFLLQALSSQLYTAFGIASVPDIAPASDSFATGASSLTFGVTFPPTATYLSVVILQVGQFHIPLVIPPLTLDSLLIKDPPRPSCIHSHIQGTFSLHDLAVRLGLTWPLSSDFATAVSSSSMTLLYNALPTPSYTISMQAITIPALNIVGRPCTAIICSPGGQISFNVSRV